MAKVNVEGHLCFLPMRLPSKAASRMPRECMTKPSDQVIQGHLKGLSNLGGGGFRMVLTSTAGQIRFVNPHGVRLVRASS